MKERSKLLLIVGVFAGVYFLPIENARVQGAFLEGLYLLKWYARKHVILCLLPAFFIAGAIGQFVSQGVVLRYLGASAKRTVAYAVASVSGSILANGADPFAVPADAGKRRRSWQDPLLMALMIAILVLLNWGAPNREVGLFAAVWRIHWQLAIGLLALLLVMIARWYDREELSGWTEATWGFAKQILPLLFGGVLVAGWIMGRPGHDAGLIPASWVSAAVGGDSLRANLVASVAGAFMYFATLTEVPILQALIGAGMGRGPALALLLAGPAVSLPNMLVINNYLGPKKTISYVSLVIVMATVSGVVFGRFFS